MKKIGFSRLALFLMILMIAGACAPITVSGEPMISIKGQATPIPIAIYPGDGSVYPSVHRTGYQLELEVEDIQLASKQVYWSVNRLGGRILFTESWNVGNRPHTRFEIAIPYQMGTECLLEFSSLGTTLSPLSVFEDPQLPIACLDCTPEIYVTLLLRQRLPSIIHPHPAYGWDPAATFQRAFRVISVLFTFIADILIWVLVVGGPPILIGWAIWRLFRHLRNKQPPAC